MRPCLVFRCRPWLATIPDATLAGTRGEPISGASATSTHGSSLVPEGETTGLTWHSYEIGGMADLGSLTRREILPRADDDGGGDGGDSDGSDRNSGGAGSDGGDNNDGGAGSNDDPGSAGNDDGNNGSTGGNNDAGWGADDGYYGGDEDPGGTQPSDQLQDRSISQSQYESDAGSAEEKFSGPTGSTLSLSQSSTMNDDGTYNTKGYVDISTSNGYHQVTPPAGGSLNISISRDSDGSISRFSITPSR